MEFLSATEADLTSAVGSLVREATDNSLSSPDWSKILDVCDLITNEPQDTGNQAIRVILYRFQENEQNVTSLSLVLIESCMKNCREKFSNAITSQFMEALTDIAKGSRGLRNSEEALRIIQEWGREFEGQRAEKPLFFDTYVDLKAKGMRFPPEDATLAAAIASDPNLAQFKTTNSNEFQKLERDLETVFDRVRLCREMLMESPGIEEDEALAEVIGFLEACRDRMTELIEAGTHGLLGQTLFSLCLKANDAILRTLEAEKMGIRIAVDDGISMRIKPADGEADLLGLDDGNVKA